jgi:hypothetical protein
MLVQVGLGNDVNESATILDDSVIDAYKESFGIFNPTLREYLEKCWKSENQFVGSSPFIQVHLLNSGILPGDSRLIKRSELEIAILRASNFLSGFFTDCGLALRTERDISFKENDLLAKTLAEDLRRRGINLKNGKLIPFEVLSLEENTESAYGAVFRLNERANIDNILDLSNFRWTSTRKSGLARAFDFWCSNFVYLGNSYASGRIVVVSGETTAKTILSRYLVKYQAVRDRKIAEVEREYQESVTKLRVD